KNTLKVKVYNKKNNKLVKTLSKKATVKVTVLKVNSVETASTTGKYLVAYFNKSLKTLKVADVTVREKDTNIMKGVESVTLSSDGKSATIALVGEETNNTNEFVERNKDYTFSVTQNGVTASTTFHVDAVLDNVTVTKTNAAKKTITVDDWTLNVPDSITVDYEEVLGSTVTVWFNESMQITKIKNVDKKVVYGAFRVNKDAATQSAYFTDLATGEKYFTQDTENGKIFVTCLINRGSAAGTNAGEVVYNYAKVTDDTPYNYAKLVLNANGTVREAVVVGAMDNFLVDEVKDQVIINGANQQSLKDYSIVKDGKTVGITAIQKGDVVFYNTTAKFAEIYTNKKTGKLESVYAGKFGFDGKVYDDTNAKRVVGQFAKMNDDYMNALLKGGKDITVYFDRAGIVRYITGEPATVATTSKTLYLTEATSPYKEKAMETLKVVGYNPATKKVETYAVPMKTLQSITLNKLGNTGSAQYVIGKKEQKYDTKKGYIDGSETVVESFVEGTNDTDGVIYVNKEVGGTAIDLVTGTVEGQKVVLTFDDQNNVTGYATDIQKDGNADTSVDLTALATAKTLKDNCDIESTTVIEGQMTASTKVFVIRTDKNTVTEQTIGTMTEKVKNGQTPNIFTWISDKVVSAIVLVGTSADFEANAEDGKAVNGVVVSFTKNTDGTAKELQAYVQGELKTYNTFAESNNTKNVALSVGDVVEITPNRDYTKVNKLEKKTIAETATKKQVTDFNPTGAFTAGGVDYQLVEAVEPTIVKLVKGANNTVEVKPYAFSELENCKYYVNVYNYANMDGVAEIIVVTDDLVQATTTPTTNPTEDTAAKFLGTSTEKKELAMAYAHIGTSEAAAKAITATDSSSATDKLLAYTEKGSIAGSRVIGDFQLFEDAGCSDKLAGNSTTATLGKAHVTVENDGTVKVQVGDPDGEGTAYQDGAASGNPATLYIKVFNTVIKLTVTL
ncbi:hypothetical protein SAMN02910358_02571, partial [Lachnospiraceae bacterium XBB1006]